LPGDMLWNVKVAAEKTQIALSTNKEVKMKKQLEYAERRVEEVQTVLSSDEKRTPKRLSAARVELEKVTESVKDTVANANKTVRESVKANPNKAVELAFAIGSKTDEIAADINQLKDAAERTGDKELVKQVADAANKTDESAYVPVQSVLEAGQNPDVVQNEKVQQEIKQLVSEKLNGVLEDTQKVRSKVEQTSGTITTTPAVSVPATTSTSATNTTGTSDRSDAGSSTSSVNTGVSSSSTPPVVVSKEVAQEVTEKTRVVEESVGEVRTLIDEGKFDEALEKIKGLNQINNQAELLLRNDVPVSIPVPASSTGQATTTGAASVEQSSTTENVGSPS